MTNSQYSKINRENRNQQYRALILRQNASNIFFPYTRAEMIRAESIGLPHPR